MGSIVAEIAEKLSATAAGTSQTGTLTIGEGDLVLGSTAVSATAAELNILDGATTTAALLNVSKDAVTANYHKVPTFADNAARNTAIPSPVVGMLIYNTASGAVQQYNGTWSTIAPAPTIDSISGYLNEDTDSTLTLFGTNFNIGSLVKMYDAASAGSQVGTNATTTFNNATKLTAVFGGAGVPVAGNTVYIEVDNAGAVNRFATAITVNADPASTHAGATGTGSNTTTHLGTYGGVTKGGSSDTNNKFTLNFDRGGGSDFEDNSNINGYGLTVVPTGNPAIESSPFGDGKSAMFFEGTDDKLTLPDSADWAMGTGDFTIEFWFNVSTTANKMFFGQSNSAGTGGEGQRALIESLFFHWEWKSTSATFDLLSTTKPAVYTWYHVAMVRNGNFLRLYLNGVEEKRLSVAGHTMHDGQGVFAIGTFGTYSSQYFHGYMDEIRVVKGVAVYTGNFTVPTVRLTNTQSAGAAGTNIAAITGTATKLLIHSNQVDDESSSETRLVIPAQAGGTAYMSHSNTKGANFGTSAAIMTGGSNNGITVNSNWNRSGGLASIGTGVYTMDFWMRQGAIGNTDRHIIYWSGGIWFNQISTGNFRYGVVNYATGMSISDNTWYHICIMRNATHEKLYLNGVLEDSHNTSGWNSAVGRNLGSPATAQPLRMGENPDNVGAYDWNGMIDEFRVSKVDRTVQSNDPLYISGGTFTPPTTAYTGDGTGTGGGNDSNTVLMLHFDGAKFVDSSPSPKTITKGSFPYHTQYHHPYSSIAPPMAWPANGKTFGSAGVYFDGGDYLDCTNWTALTASGTTPFTIDFWLNFKQSDTTGSYIPIMGQAQSGGYFNINLKVQGNNTATLYVYNGTQHDSGHVISDGVWHHCVVSRNASNVLNIWVDGTRRATFASHTTNYNQTTPWAIGWDHVQGYKFKGFLDNIRISYVDCMADANDLLYSSNGTTYTVPTTLHGAATVQVLPTITFTGTASAGLAANEDIEFTSVANSGKPANNQHLTDSGIGLVLTNLTGGNKHKATLTGTIASAGGTTHSNMPMKVQVRKTLATAAYANASRTVTFSGSETTIGLAPAMPVSGTGIPVGATITSIDTSTTITLSANPTGGTLTGQSLIFEDLSRIAHINGTDVLDNAQAMLSISSHAGVAAPTLFNARRYMGDAVVGNSIHGFGFQPDLIIAKQRITDSRNWTWVDSMRGPYYVVDPSRDVAPYNDGNSLSNFTADGFTSGNTSELNAIGKPYISYGFIAGGVPSGVGLRRTDNGITETNLTTSGTVGADVYHSNLSNVSQSVNSAGQFSITRYTTNNTGNDSHIPHGLTGAPNFVIIKALSVNPWVVWHSSLATPTTQYLVMNTNAAVSYHAEIWNNEVPSATSLKFGAHSYTNNHSLPYMMYAWKAVAGVSHFGSFVHSGSNVTTTGVGFTPKMLIVKDLASNQWVVLDSVRGTGYYVRITNVVEGTISGDVVFNSDGFVTTAGGLLGENGHTYIYAAFA